MRRAGSVRAVRPRLSTELCKTFSTFDCEVCDLLTSFYISSAKSSVRTGGTAKAAKSGARAFAGCAIRWTGCAAVRRAGRDRAAISERAPGDAVCYCQIYYFSIMEIQINLCTSLCA